MLYYISTHIQAQIANGNKLLPKHIPAIDVDAWALCHAVLIHYAGTCLVRQYYYYSIACNNVSHWKFREDCNSPRVTTLSIRRNSLTVVSLLVCP